MGIIEAVINSILMLLIIPFIFSRGLDNFINRLNVLYKTANYDDLVEKFASHKWPRPLSKAERIARDYSIKEEVYINGFISKISPFLIGVLTTLVTLFFTDKI